MMAEHRNNPRSSDFGIGSELVPAANAVAAFLALDEFDPDIDRANFDLVVLAGNAILSTAIGAFEVAKTICGPVLITGGIGHSTSLLAGVVAGQKAYAGIAVEERPEADILRDIAVYVHGLDEAQVLVEPASTNCGENAEFSLRLLDRLGIRPRKPLLIQDPLMQRRTDASFKRAWSASTWQTEFVNWPTFIPRLEYVDGRVGYVSSLSGPLWTGQRFMSLLLGEIPRLRDDEDGYGPRGKGFITHVDIPDEIEEHYRALVAHFRGESPALSRSIGAQ